MIPFGIKVEFKTLKGLNDPERGVMSRSHKKTPICGNCSTSGQKAFRSQENRSKRHRVKQLCHTGLYDKMPHDKEYGNEWDSPRDGKHWLTSDGQSYFN